MSSVSNRLIGGKSTVEIETALTPAVAIGSRVFSLFLGVTDLSGHFVCLCLACSRVSLGSVKAESRKSRKFIKEL